MRIVKIYGLLDPITAKVFYVGATQKPLSERLMQHISILNGSGVVGKYVAERRKIHEKCKRRKIKIKIVELESVELKASGDAEMKWFNDLLGPYNIYQKTPGCYFNQNRHASTYVVKPSAAKKQKSQ